MGTVGDQPALRPVSADESSFFKFCHSISKEGVALYEKIMEVDTI